MPRRLDKLLKPGERVIHRPTVSASAFLKASLALGVICFSYVYGLWWLARAIKESIPTHPAVVATMFGGVGFLLPMVSILRGRMMAVLTNRRLLFLAAPIARRPKEVALSAVLQVHGLVKGSRLPAQVETIEGETISFAGELWGRPLGLAVSDAAGLTADQRESGAERVAGLFYRADSWGMMSGLAVFLPAWVLVLGAVRPVLGTISLPTALGLLFATILVLGLASIFAGRILGTVLTACWIRRSTPANEMRDAVGLLAHRRLLPREKDELRRLQPLVWRVAGFAPEQRSHPSQERS